jgi:hypothetical protein
MQVSEPMYLMPVNDPHIEANRELYAMMAEAENHTLRMQVDVADVEEGSCGQIQTLMMALQHYPHLIEKMIFSFVFDFVEDEKTGIVLPEEVWKQEPVFYQWFQRMMGLPFAWFFIADEDARYYALMADMIVSGELDSVVDERSGLTGFSFTEAQGQEIVRRVWGSCLNMLQFCYGSGFDPQAYIEGMMALLGVQFTYEELLAEFETFRLKGAYRVVERAE